MRRAALCLALAALPALVWAAVAGAAAPAGPRLAYVELSGQPERLELKSVDADGGQPLLLAGGSVNAIPLPGALEGISWAPDGAHVAFTGSDRHAEEFGSGEHSAQIYLAPAEGGLAQAVPGTIAGHTPVFSPNGREVAFERLKTYYRRIPGGRKLDYRSVSIWLADLVTGVSHRITPWRRGLEMEATSFSPDGSRLVATRTRPGGTGPEVVLMSAGGGGRTVLAQRAADAVFSPDGSRLAYLGVQTTPVGGRSRGGRKARLRTTTDLFTMSADGSDHHRLTDSPKGLEIWPSWDPSGQRLAVTRLRVGGLGAVLGVGDSVVELNADGSCPKVVLQATRRSALYGATWQPGPGRAAGPIFC